MPEGDALRRAAQRLQVLVGQRVAVETPNPRAAGKHLVERLDGKLLESVEAVGKHLLLHFEGGLVLQNHLRMTGRWRVEPRGVRIHATAATTGQTGVEMEALTASAVAALTVYDMTKALDKSIEIQDVYLLEKTGVATVPGEAFYHGSEGNSFLRFCYAKPDVDLQEACRRLGR